MVADDTPMAKPPQLYLSGTLAQIAGAAPPFRFETLAQAGGLLRVNAPAIRDLGDAEVEVRINARPVGIDALHWRLPPGARVEIDPAGGGGMETSEGLGKIVLGALLSVTAGLYASPSPGSAGGEALSLLSTTASDLAATVALKNISSRSVADLMTDPNPEPEPPSASTYNGPTTTQGEGTTMPLLYGYARVGGVLIQRSLDTVVS